jgi:hypothetical protein
MKEFLINIDVKGNITDLISKLVRGEVLSFIVPENRDPYIKNILKYGAQANPYKLGKDASNVGMLRKK